MKNKLLQKSNLIITLFVGLLAFILAGCAPQTTPAAELTPLTVQLRWKHQAQFAGFYMADQKGYYAEEGLKVIFLEGTPTTDFIAPVLDGSAQFSITNPDSLLTARAQGKPVRAIATIFRRNPAVLIALSSSGITQPQDFVGKTIQIGPAGVPRLRTLMSKVGIATDQYRVVDSTADLTPFYSGAVDVRGVNLTNEVLAAKAAGYEINIIYYDDYGIHFSADTIFTSDELIASNPDLVLRFLRATLKGWTYAVENPGEVGAIVVHFNPQADIQFENEKMSASLPLINTGENYIGWMKPEIWTGMEQTLREQGILTAPLDVTQVYTMQFLEEVYK
jgi:NitT/TauT family transport system substrate-binding protein